jgi:methyl-accepting chemotaxis protein/hemerythrin
MEQNTTLVNEGKSAVDKALTSFNAIPGLVSEVNKAIQSISSVAEENAAGAEEVNASVEQVQATIGNVSGAAQKLNEGANSLKNLISKFKTSDDSSADKLFEWDDSLSVKVTEIDNQHKRLIDLINQLHKAMGEGKSKEEIDGILNGLIDYTKTHFGYEENLFDKYKYPETTQHKQAHIDLVKQVVEFEKKFKEGKENISMDLMNFLKNWLINHIKGTDQKYSKFLNDHGER